jgi:hypothetical protein
LLRKKLIDRQRRQDKLKKSDVSKKSKSLLL